MAKEDLNKLFDQGQEVQSIFDQGQELSEDKPLLPQTSEGGTTSGDLVLGGLSGLTFGAAPSISGAAEAAGDVLFGDKKLKDIIDLYLKHKKESEKTFEQARERSPYAFTAGELAGGLGSGALAAPLLGGVGAIKAATAGKRILEAGKLGAKYGALGGALSSEGSILEGADGAGKILEDTAKGAAIGGVAGGALHGVFAEAIPGAISSAKDAASKHDWSRQMMLAAENKRKFGIDPTSDVQYRGRDEIGKVAALSEKPILAEKTSIDAEDLTQKILSADEMLANNVNKTLDNAKNIKISPSKETTGLLSDLVQPTGEQLVPSRGVSRGVVSTIEKLYDGDLNPITYKEILSRLDDNISTYENATDPDHVAILKKLYELRKAIRRDIGDAVPGYNQAAGRYQEFRQLIPEQLIAGDVPVQIRNKLLKEVGNGKEAIFANAKDMLSTANLPGTSGQEGAIRLNNLLKNLNAISEKEKVMGISPENSILSKFGNSIQQVKDDLVKRSDEAAIISTVRGIQPLKSPYSTFKDLAFSGVSSTGRGMGLASAIKVGSAQRALDKPAELGKKLYNASNEKLMGIVNKLRTNNPDDSTTRIANHLEQALNSGDSAKKNAALFSILQNPLIRGKIAEPSDEDSVTESTKKGTSF